MTGEFKQGDVVWHTARKEWGIFQYYDDHETSYVVFGPDGGRVTTEFLRRDIPTED